MHQILHLFMKSKAVRVTLLAVSVSLFTTVQANAMGFVIQYETDAPTTRGGAMKSCTSAIIRSRIS